MRDGFDPDTFRLNNAINNAYGTSSSGHQAASPRTSFSRSLSANTPYGSFGRASGSQISSGGSTHPHGRARSGSLVTVTEVGGDEPDNVNDRLGVGANFNAAWVNSPGEFKSRVLKSPSIDAVATAALLSHDGVFLLSLS
jgi:hypothetical protein